MTKDFQGAAVAVGIALHCLSESQVLLDAITPTRLSILGVILPFGYLPYMSYISRSVDQPENCTLLLKFKL